jgi:hypothetical protein
MHLEIGVLVGVFFLGFLVPNLYLKYRNWLDSRGVLVHFFDPPEDVCVLEMAYLFDKKFHFRDVLGWLVDLKFRGFLSFERNEGGDVIVVKEKELVTGVEFEKYLWDLYLGEMGEGRDLRLVLSSYLNSLLPLTMDFWKDLSGKGYLVLSKGRLSVVAGLVGLICFVIGAFAFSEVHIGIVFAVCFVWVGLMTWIALKTPKRSERGRKVYKEMLGFADYLKVAEKDREKFRQELETRKLELEAGDVEFSSLLPYMIVLNVDKRWYETLIPELQGFVDEEDGIGGVSSYGVRK